MACDAFAEVMYRSKVYSDLPFYAKFPLALSSFIGIVTRFYGGIYPFVIGGRIKRSFMVSSFIHGMANLNGFNRGLEQTTGDNDVMRIRKKS
jgi:hypothetical protein